VIEDCSEQHLFPLIWDAIIDATVVGAKDYNPMKRFWQNEAKKLNLFSGP